ncbi:hypothetical protein SKAU_G00368200 [Synaphobranchus kaupii]|uniref:Uncharacterized protein n=1 Tax=Synaphobranchus kaupii TaxID=118154 RepID=A0A9Q1EFI0_SYNKA|nr:hypothetical protein SKAU_G00368200 [Synaphobranchus kaupii]
MQTQPKRSPRCRPNLHGLGREQASDAVPTRELRTDSNRQHCQHSATLPHPSDCCEALAHERVVSVGEPRHGSESAGGDLAVTAALASPPSGHVCGSRLRYRAVHLSALSYAHQLAERWPILSGCLSHAARRLGTCRCACSARPAVTRRPHYSARPPELRPLAVPKQRRFPRLPAYTAPLRSGRQITAGAFRHFHRKGVREFCVLRMKNSSRYRNTVISFLFSSSVVRKTMQRRDGVVPGIAVETPGRSPRGSDRFYLAGVACN